jgi:hypothetical protein
MIVSGVVVGRVIPVERVPNQDRARIAQLGVLTTVLITIAFVMLSYLLLWSVTNRPSITLTPDGLILRRHIRKVISWDQLKPGSPARSHKRNPATIHLHLTTPDRRSKRMSLPAGGLHIDTAFLAYTIRWYVVHSDDRSRIGDAFELEKRLRGFVAAD